MLFGLFRKKRPAAPEDPLATYDRVLAELEHEAAELRKSAATLLALRGDLGRAIERHEAKLRDIDDRRAVAAERRDAHAADVLEDDRRRERRALQAAQDALAQAESDGALLIEAAQDVSRRATELREERHTARMRLTAGQAVTGALHQRPRQFDQVVALDGARDEVERAHALAELYRDERQK